MYITETATVPDSMAGWFDRPLRSGSAIHAWYTMTTENLGLPFWTWTVSGCPLNYGPKQKWRKWGQFKNTKFWFCNFKYYYSKCCTMSNYPHVLLSTSDNKQKRQLIAQLGDRNLPNIERKGLGIIFFMSFGFNVIY